MSRVVYILTPSYDAKNVCDFTVCIAEIFRIAAQNYPDMELRLHFWMGEALLQKARNNLFAVAVNGKADDIVFIDADQSFPVQAFFDLLNAPVDAVGIPTPMKTNNERYNIRPEKPLKHEWDSRVGLLRVECIGTGMIRLSRRAIQALWDASTPYNDEGEKRLICDVQIINGGMISEDVQICEKLQAAGIPVYADIRYTCDHFGMKKYVGNYKLHYARHLIEQHSGENE